MASTVSHEGRGPCSWQVGVLERTWQRWDDEAEEVNVFGQAMDPGRPGQFVGRGITGRIERWIVGADVARI